MKEKTKWKRSCPKCGVEKVYITLIGYTKAVNNNSKCVKCAYKFSSKKWRDNNQTDKVKQKRIDSRRNNGKEWNTKERRTHK